MCVLQEGRVPSRSGALGNGLQIKAQYVFLPFSLGNFQVNLLSLTAVPSSFSCLKGFCAPLLGFLAGFFHIWRAEDEPEGYVILRGNSR